MRLIGGGKDPGTAGTEEDSPRACLIGKQGESKVDAVRPNSLIADLHDLVTKALAWNTWFLLLVFVMTYTLSFLFHGCLWYAVAQSDSSCLTEVRTFHEAFMFSIETQATIGYGFKHINGGCKRGTVLLLLQVLTGYFIDAMILSILYSKLTQSKRRGYLLRCSRFAVITNRNNRQCLMVRVGDRRHKASLISNNCSMLMISEEMTEEGEYLPYRPRELTLETESFSSTPLLLIPWTLIHYITPESPLYGLTQEDLAARRSEIVLIMEGTVQEVGLRLQLRTSYTPEEVLFHHRFKNIVHRHDEGGCWIDWEQFDQVESDGSPDAPSSKMTMASVLPVVLNERARMQRGVHRKRPPLRNHAQSLVERPSTAFDSFLYRDRGEGAAAGAGGPAGGAHPLHASSRQENARDEIIPIEARYGYQQRYGQGQGQEGMQQEQHGEGTHEKKTTSSSVSNAAGAKG